jgi:pilus assembly protein CpaE
MRSSRPQSVPNRTRVVVQTADDAFEQSVRTMFSASAQIDLAVLSGTLADNESALAAERATVVVVDIDTADADEMEALQRLMPQLSGSPPVVVVAQAFDAQVARKLLQLRAADFMVKPVQPIDLVRTCARVVQTPLDAEPTEAEIYTFLPAVGGAGVTTLAIQTALVLLGSGQRSRPSTCLVDLNFQHGTCADYLDLEPRLDLKEIEPSPDRLDRQLLEVMLSHHGSGLALIAAPNQPAEMRSFDPDMVTRLLDLVSSHFKYVVIDMPRTWFAWTDSVLLGSNRLFVVSETTVPSLRHARQLCAAIRERLGDSPRPQVLINRFEQRMFGAGLRRSDIMQALGDDFAGFVSNDYRLVREAIDRGVPLQEINAGNKITAQVKKLMIPQAEKLAEAGKTPARKLSLLWAR